MWPIWLSYISPAWTEYAVSLLAIVAALFYLHLAALSVLGSVR